MKNKYRYITKDEALEAVKNIDGDVIHSFLGMFGADWDKEDVIKKIETAKKWAWTKHMINHELAVDDGKSVYHFDLLAPDPLTQ